MKLSAETLKKLDDAFSPSAPITSQEFFLGRLDQLDDVVDGINERGQHIVVYGERGVGKTSFANIVGTRLIGVYPVKVTCNRTDGFKALWDKAFKRVQFERTSAGTGFTPVERQESLNSIFSCPTKTILRPWMCSSSWKRSTRICSSSSTNTTAFKAKRQLGRWRTQ